MKHSVQNQPDSIRPTGGQVMKAARRSRRITQEMISELLNCSVLTISKWERGLTQPSYDDVLIVVEDVCGLSYKDAQLIAKKAA